MQRSIMREACKVFDVPICPFLSINHQCTKKTYCQNFFFFGGGGKLEGLGEASPHLSVDETLVMTISSLNLHRRLHS